MICEPWEYRAWGASRERSAYNRTNRPTSPNVWIHAHIAW